MTPNTNEKESQVNKTYKHLSLSKESVNLFENSELDILQDLHNSSTVIMHDTEELLQDLKEKGLIEKNLEEYFNK